VVSTLETQGACNHHTIVFCDECNRGVAEGFSAINKELFL
jgi:hypothetical protein